MKKKYVTMQDIAKTLNVSRSAVSFALNDRYDGIRISDSMRNDIKKTAYKMGYCRNAVVQSLVTGRTKMIACIEFGDLDYEYAFRAVNGFINKVSEKNYSVRSFSVNKSSSFDTVFQQIVEQRLEGIVARKLPPGWEKLLLKRAEARKIPVAFLDQEPEVNKGIYVNSDDSLGVREAIQFLYEQGHRHIGNFSLDCMAGDKRSAAFFDEVKRLKIKNLPEDNAQTSNHNEQRKIAEQLIARSPEERPSAYFCSSDYIATILMQEAFRKQVSVPENLSIIGFGNLNVIHLLNSDLTTVNQPFEEMGACAADLLINEIESKDCKSFKEAIVKKVKTKLVKRETTCTRTENS